MEKSSSSFTHGRSWPSAGAVLGGMVWCAWEYAGASADAGSADDVAFTMWLALVIALPVLAAPIAAAMRARSPREEFWVTLEQLALTYAVAGACFATAIAGIGAVEEDNSGAKLAGVLTCALVALAAGAGVAAVRRGVSGRMTGAILAGAGAAMVLATTESYAQERGLPFEIPAIVAGGFVGRLGGRASGGFGDGAERCAACGAGRAGGVGAGHRGRMTQGGGCRKEQLGAPETRCLISLNSRFYFRCLCIISRSKCLLRSETAKCRHPKMRSKSIEDCIRFTIPLANA